MARMANRNTSWSDDRRSRLKEKRKQMMERKRRRRHERKAKGGAESNEKPLPWWVMFSRFLMFLTEKLGKGKH